ncbi:acyl-CoA dehydratase activase-related protein [Carboxydothermus ferrireducens]|uniref:Nucleotide-binding protein (Sugar kinase/HSP70/actin superfamily) n=1 Tax=Carboxydothermus ferrireducens DSM 11255 TaxID=1119529 RepID=A0ABX2RED4_9THEO|nr:acyl-CoA dehydratase activase-related protein [Carboxydothermus ferrireducens]NYE58178.1 putative nucleotide-binding protein (sugar kinase/HSP70/actin superfamily) [Carboxydothermus ferrireducens DSM 11255]
MNAPVIGIARTLNYYAYYPFWQGFFDSLNLKTVVSSPTTKEILDQGVKDALAEACLPIKLFFGHIATLKTKVDYLFIPRIVNLNRKTVYCPKFLGLPDMIKYSYENLPPVIDIRVDNRNLKDSLLLSSLKLASFFGFSKLQGFKAYREGIRRQNLYENLLQKGYLPVNEVNVNSPKLFSVKSSFKIALLGYPYLVYDNYVNLKILEFLHKNNVQVLTAEQVPWPIRNKYAPFTNKKRLFWTFSDRVLSSFQYFLKNVPDLKGIIHLTAFGCGPDFIVDRIMEIDAGEQQIPYLTLTIDEHTGEAGLVTRVEAFLDMIKRKSR